MAGPGGAVLGIQLPRADGEKAPAWGQADAFGYAASTLVHADVLDAGDTRLVNVDVGFSAALAASKELKAEIRTEVGRVIGAPAGSKGYARASGLEVGLAQSPRFDGQVILAGKAETAAPPSPVTDARELGPLDLDPLVRASLLKGAAQTASNSTTCVLGDDLARGLGYADDVQLLTAGDTAPGERMPNPILTTDPSMPGRVAGNSVSRMSIVPETNPQAGATGSFGLSSQSRQTFAPVTLFKSSPARITIELLGEWVLQAVATGHGGGASIHYGPAETSPETPVVRIITGLAPVEVTTVLSLQQVLGPQGFVLSLPGLGEMAIGGHPRAIDGAAGSTATEAPDGTEAAAVVDVVRLNLAPLGLTDVRIGHMEVQARVPAGGIGCPIPVARMPADTSARAGEPSRGQITIENPFACDLRDVRLQDFMLLDGPGALRVNAVSNGGASTGSDKGRILDWNLGTIPRGGRRTVSADVTATAGDSSIVDETVVQATCGLDDGQRGGTRQVDVPLSGHTTSNVPVSAARSSHILGR